MGETRRYSGPAEVAAVERAAGDAVVLRLAAPAVAGMAAPGQFVMVRSPDRVDPLLPRPFSVHDVEGDDLLLLIRLVGRTSTMLAEVEAGQALHLVGPLGRGFTVDVAQPPPAADNEGNAAQPGAAVPPGRHILVGGGMGVAPFPFLLRTLHERGAAVQVLMGASGQDGLYTPDRLDPEHQSAITEDGSSGRQGLVTELLSEALDEGPGATVYACGPQGMLAAVGQACTERGVPCQLSLEAMMACGTGLCHGCAVRMADGTYGRVCKDGPVFNAADLAAPWWT